MTNSGQKASADLWLECYENIDIQILNITPEKPDPNLEIKLISKISFGENGNEFLAAQLIFTASGNDNIYQRKIQQKKNILVHTNHPVFNLITIPYKVSVVLGAIILAKNGNHNNENANDNSNVNCNETGNENGNEDQRANGKIIGENENEMFEMYNMENVFVISGSALEMNNDDIYNGNVDVQDVSDISDSESSDDKENNYYDNENDENNDNNRNNNKYDFSREFYFKNIFPMPIRIISVSTVSCGSMFSIEAPFLLDTNDAQINKSSISDDNTTKLKNSNTYSDTYIDIDIHINNDNGKCGEETNIDASNFVQIDGKAVDFPPASIAGSYQNWPPIIVTFHEDVAMAVNLRTDSFSTYMSTSSTRNSNSNKNSDSTTPTTSAGMGVDAGAVPPFNTFLPSKVIKSNFLPATCWLEIHSNKSTHRIPMYVVDGRVRLTSMSAVSE